MEREEIEKKFGISYPYARSVIREVFNHNLTEKDYERILFKLPDYDAMYNNPTDESKEFCIELAYIDTKGMSAFSNIDIEDLLF